MKIIDKVFKDKKSSSVIYILLAAGILLIAFGSGLAPKHEKKPETQIEAVQMSEEERLSAVLAQIKGAGNVSVHITYSDNGKKVFGYDTDGKNKKTVILNTSSGDEALVSEEIPSKILGIIVVADGGNNTLVRAALTNAVKIATGVPTHKIAVFERKDNQ